MEHQTVVHVKDSIATRLLAVVFGIYFIVTLTVTLAHMLAEYRNTKIQLHDDLIGYQNTFQQGLALGLWNLDPQQVNSIANGMLTLSSIVGVTVFDIDGQSMASQGMIRDEEGKLVLAKDGQNQPVQSQLLFSGLISHSFPVIHYDEGNPNEVGRAVFYSSEGVVFEKVQYGFLFIIVNSIIKTASLWVIFLIVSRRLLSHPLSLLTTATHQLDLDSLENVRLNLPTHGRNELKILEEAFQIMIRKLILARSRTTSLRAFANKISDFTQPIESLRYAFQEMCSNTSVTNGVFFFEQHEAEVGNEEETQHQELFQTQVYTFLNDRLTPKHWSQLTSQIENEVTVWNGISYEHPLFKIFATVPEAKTIGCHFVLIRVQAMQFHAMLLYRTADLPPFDSADVEYLKSMVAEIKTAHANIQSILEKARMESELRTAAAVQKALFPRKLPNVANLELASFFQSASETGGDWYGFMTQLEGYLYILIGDVTGHGTPAALVTATASATTQTLEQMFQEDGTVPTPAQFMNYLNRAVFHTGAPDFLMTFFAACIDLKSGKLTFSNAGHNFPILMRANGKMKHLLNANIRLGNREEWQFAEASMQLEPGDLIFFYTDGLTENSNPAGQMWGERKLVSKLRKYREQPVKDMVSHIVQDAYDFYNDHPLEDDTTIVACRIVGEFSGPEDS